MTLRLLAASILAAGIAVVAGLYGAVDLPIPGLTLNEDWCAYTVACGVLLGILGACIAAFHPRRR